MVHSSVVLFNSCCTVSPGVHCGVGTLLSRTHGINTVVCCSIGFHHGRTNRTVGLVKAIVRGLRCTSVIHKSSRSFRILCRLSRKTGICARGATFCYPHLLCDHKTGKIRIRDGALAGRCTVRPVVPIDAVNTNSGLGTNILCNVVGGHVHHSSLSCLSRRS